jgi:alpha/beta superfamily hydrolase
VRATLDAPADGSDTSDGGGPGVPGTAPTREADACVVACPPHPKHGGRRSDRRLRTVADSLAEAGVACLRFDYGPWDRGRGERRDAGNALDWAGERYERVALFGYSFGGAVALSVATDRTDLAAVAALAPAPALPDGSDTVATLDRVEAPTLVVYGERDESVDWRPVVERARELGHRVESRPTDHRFVGVSDGVADTVGPFLVDSL